MTREEINEWLVDMKINKFVINEDLTVDVFGNALILRFKGDRLPVKFGNVTGIFSCQNTGIKTLEGCPDYVGTYFYCSLNELTSLEHSPKYVGADYICSCNPITNLKDISSYIGKNTEAQQTMIDTFEYLPEQLGGNIILSHENILVQEFKDLYKADETNMTLEISLKEIESIRLQRKLENRLDIKNNIYKTKKI